MNAATPGQADEINPWRALRFACDGLERICMGTAGEADSSSIAEKALFAAIGHMGVSDIPEGDAAQQPQPAPGSCDCGESPCARPQPAPELTREPHAAPGPHRHAFAAADCACPPDCECWRRSLAPQPAPGLLALQLIIAVDALRDIADEPHAGYGPVRAAKALDDIGTPGFSEPQPAPGLAAAMAETRELRTVLDEATRYGRNLAASTAAKRKFDAMRKLAGLPPVEGR